MLPASQMYRSGVFHVAILKRSLSSQAILFNTIKTIPPPPLGPAIHISRHSVKPVTVQSTSRAFVGCLRWCSSHRPTSSSSQDKPVDTESPPGRRPDITVTVDHGLPQLTIPLPSRREMCRFTLRPVTHSVADLIAQLQHEDKGIDRVVVSTTDRVRIASSTSIESLLMNDFNLIINDISFRVNVPFNKRVTQEEISDLSDVKQLVNKLYSALNVDEFQLLKERNIIAQIEAIKEKLVPLERKRLHLVSAAERRTTFLSWAGLSYMAIQFGFLARLTWWEYSWDIMEPVTYFVTYGTAIAAYAYYVVTRQDFILPDVRDRQFLLSFYRRANKQKLNVCDYNGLKESLAKLEGDLRRLRDPLARDVATVRLERDPAVHDVFAKTKLSIKNLFSGNTK